MKLIPHYVTPNTPSFQILDIQQPHDPWMLKCSLLGFEWTFRSERQVHNPTFPVLYMVLDAVCAVVSVY